MVSFARVLGTLSTVTLLKYGPPFDLPFLAHLFFLNGAVWLVLAPTLSRWNFARWATIVWCAFDIARLSYDFFSVARSHSEQVLEGAVDTSIIVIELVIIVYLFARQKRLSEPLDSAEPQQ